MSGLFYKRKTLIPKTVAILSALMLLFPLAGCQKKSSQKEFTTFNYFDTVITFSGFPENDAEFEEASTLFDKLFEKYHKEFDIYNEYDGLQNICSINALNSEGAHEKCTVSADIIDLLRFSREMYELTSGMTNVAMGSVTGLWHTARETGLVPDDAALKEAAKHTSWDTIEIDPVNNTVFISDPLQTLDVGAVAKGYATELVARELISKGFTAYIINAGGTVRALGNKKADSSGSSELPWNAAIENPTLEGGYVAIVPLTDTVDNLSKAIATSGSYQRYFEAGGRRYHHIIHPDTLYPADHWSSVSVVCADAGVADALSTAFFNVATGDIEAFLDDVRTQYSIESLFLVTPDGRVVTF